METEIEKRRGSSSPGSFVAALLGMTAAVSPDPVLRDVRDGVALVEYPEASERDANGAAVALSRKLRGMPRSGVLDAIPAARTLCVLFDPSRLSRERLSRQIERAGRSGSEGDAARGLFRIPVVYDGEDLADLARRARLSSDDVVRRHARPEYRVAFLGFAPGFPYLTGLPAELHAPRLPRPRSRVPAGSVAIGGPYTGVYPTSTPGGWRLIGRTSARLFEPDAERPALLSPGDLVRFEPVPALSAPARGQQERPRRAEKPILRVLSPGLFTTIQGAPRHGLASFGVPAGGAMDLEGLSRANDLVGNTAGAPALEITLAGPELEVLEDCVVALAGGDFSAEWNGKAAPAGEAFRVAAGARIGFGRARSGARAYLAVRGGLEAPRLTRRIEAGDCVGLGSQTSVSGRTAAPPVRLGAEVRLRVILGPQADHFSAATIERFFASAWRVSSTSDRRGLRLEGGRLEHAAASEIPPEGTVPGSVQVPGNGLPIVLGPDGPVTGGYAKIATVIGADLSLLGQAAPGAVLVFAAVSLRDALAARREYD